MTVISFALPEESKDLVRRVAGANRSGARALPLITGLLSGREVTILHCGMGMDSATALVDCFLDMHAPSLWIAAGFGGGLCPDLNVGDIFTARNFSDARLLDAVAAIPARCGALITTREAVETAVQKRDLYRHTGALAVDMETTAIHRLCAARSIPVLAIRAISDAARDDLPVPATVWFDGIRQRPRPIALLLYLGRHPGRILPFARFVSGIGRARAQLTAYLLAALEALPLR